VLRSRLVVFVGCVDHTDDHVWFWRFGLPGYWRLGVMAFLGSTSERCFLGGCGIVVCIGLYIPIFSRDT